MFSFFSRRGKIEELRWLRSTADRNQEWRLIAALDRVVRVRNPIRTSPSILGAVPGGVGIEVTIRAGTAELIGKRMRAVVPASRLGDAEVGRLIGLAIGSGGVLVGLRVIPTEITDPAVAERQLDGWIPG